MTKVSWAGSLWEGLCPPCSLCEPLWAPALGTGVENLSSAKPPRFATLLFVLIPEFAEKRPSRPPRPHSIYNI